MEYSARVVIPAATTRPFRAYQAGFRLDTMQNKALNSRKYNLSKKDFSIQVLIRYFL